MFTLLGATIGTLIALVTLMTNFAALIMLDWFSLLIVFLMIFGTYLGIGTFVGLIVDVIFDKFRK